MKSGKLSGSRHRTFDYFFPFESIEAPTEYPGSALVNIPAVSLNFFCIDVNNEWYCFRIIISAFLLTIDMCALRANLKTIKIHKFVFVLLSF